MKEILDKSEWLKLVCVITFVIIGSMIYSSSAESIQVMLPKGNSSITMSQTMKLLGTFFFHLAAFIIPALICQMLFSSKGNFYIESKTASLKIYLQSLGLIILLLLSTGIISNISKGLIDLTPIAKWAQSMSELGQAQVKELIQSSSNSGVFLLKVLVIAIIPAIGEELLFRGLLTKISIRLFKNTHLGIILPGVLFAALHMQPYNFLSMSIIGVLFGYLYWYTKDIKVTILLHFLFNLSSLLLAEFVV